MQQKRLKPVALCQCCRPALMVQHSIAQVYCTACHTHTANLQQWRVKQVRALTTVAMRSAAGAAVIETTRISHHRVQFRQQRRLLLRHEEQQLRHHVRHSPASASA